MSKRAWLITGLIGVPLILIGYYLFNPAQDEPRVRTGKAVIEKISATLFLDGKVELSGKRDIRVQTLGTVRSVGAYLGDRVKKGQLLVTLETRELEAQRKAAQAQVQSAQETLRQIRNIPPVPVPGLENATSSIIRGAELEVRTARGVVERINTQIKAASVTSPVEGTVLNKNVNPGMAVSPEMTLMTIGELKNLMIRAQITETDYLKIKKGQRVKITGEAFPGREYFGEISNIAQVPTTGATIGGVSGIGTTNAPEGTYPVEIRIVSKDTVLKPGFSTSLEVVTTTKDRALVVSNEAIIEREDKKQVYIVQRNVVKIRRVRTGIEAEEKTEIVEGLTAGDRVILNPDENKLKENTKVKVK